MSKQTNERAFEVHVEEMLLRQGGWQAGTNAGWDVGRALFPRRICEFLEVTQPKRWAEMRGLHAAGAETQEKATTEEKAQAKMWEEEIAKRRYAVIVDEAHSSQTGETARELKAILGAGAAEDAEGEIDWEDRLNFASESKGASAALLCPAQGAPTPGFRSGRSEREE